MSGSNSSRDDGPRDVGRPVGGNGDPCVKRRRGPINSPKSAVLSKLSVGDVLKVDVHNTGVNPILTVSDSSGAVAGSLTFIGYLEIIDCIQSRGFSYEATIVSITGGVYEVSVEPT